MVISYQRVWYVEEFPPERGDAVHAVQIWQRACIRLLYLIRKWGYCGSSERIHRRCKSKYPLDFMCKPATCCPRVMIFRP